MTAWLLEGGLLDTLCGLSLSLRVTVPLIGIGLLLSLAVPAGADIRTIILDPTTTRPLSLTCSVGKATRIVFPEPSLRLKVSPGAKKDLGIRLLSARPKAVIEVVPPSGGATGTVEFLGSGGTVILQLRSAVKQGPAEIVLVRKAPDAPSRTLPKPTARDGNARPAPPTLPALPSAAPSPEAPAVRSTNPTATPGIPPAATPQPVPNTMVSAAPTTVAGVPGAQTLASSPSPLPPSQASSTGFDVQAFLLARPERIGRRESMPGRGTTVLEDLLKSDRWVWLRFRLEGGAKDRLKSLTWEHGSISAQQAVVEGRDLRVLVQLPKTGQQRVTRKTRVVLTFEKAGAFKFPLSAPWLSTRLSGWLGLE